MLTVTLTVAGSPPGATTAALLTDSALFALRGGLACLATSPLGVVSQGDVLALTAGNGAAAPAPVSAGQPGNAAAGPWTCVSGTATEPTALPPPPNATFGNASITLSVAVTMAEGRRSLKVDGARALQASGGGGGGGPLGPLVTGVSSGPLTPLQAKTLAMLATMSGNLDIAILDPTRRSAELGSWLGGLGNPALIVSVICVGVAGTACQASYSPSGVVTLVSRLVSSVSSSPEPLARSPPIGAIAGGAVGAFLLLALAVAGCIVVHRSRVRRRRRPARPDFARNVSSRRVIARGKSSRRAIVGAEDEEGQVVTVNNVLAAARAASGRFAAAPSAARDTMGGSAAKASVSGVGAAFAPSPPARKPNLGTGAGDGLHASPAEIVEATVERLRRAGDASARAAFGAQSTSEFAARVDKQGRALFDPRGRNVSMTAAATADMSPAMTKIKNKVLKKGLSAGSRAQSTGSKRRQIDAWESSRVLNRSEFEDFSSSNPLSATLVSQYMLPEAATDPGATSAAAALAPTMLVSSTPRRDAAHAAAASVGSRRQLSTVQATLPEGWFVAVDDEGDEYYYTADGLTSTWVRPTDPPPDAAASAAGDKDEADNAAATAVATDDPLPTGWKRAVDASGTVYFYTEDGATTTWERPTTAESSKVPAEVPSSAASAVAPTAARSVRRLSLKINGEKMGTAAWQEQAM